MRIASFIAYDYISEKKRKNKKGVKSETRKGKRDREEKCV